MTKQKRSDKNSKQKESDSIVEACLPFADLMGGEIKHVSFDCPKNLRTAFNSATKANSTTSCHTLRGFMQAYVVASHYRKACFPNTNEPVVIENLVMPTYVKQKIRRYAEEVTEVEFLERSTCEFSDCKRKGIFGVLQQTSGYRKEVKACKKCFEKWKADLHYEVVRVVSDG